uniref:Uncharacterized protein LOC116956615 isoform X1 n=1 Tax=Petromyzon marinus TaxID=7757 RepID=A0AAJ7XGV1_PETMA|nr:uncharacterized protein LOC116956615 isoform X1 [Petromyzon marinus]XP_032834245.1 uncharacterized protein LOC116956615 isoform X1 [Petromyzon marinus]XP_032834246.1 uncharacterized protein LOC116956615 isoform X1 [Petromyzon marinus]
MASHVELAFIKQESDETPSPIMYPDATGNRLSGPGVKEEDDGSLGTEIMNIVVKSEVEEDAPDVNIVKVEGDGEKPEETGDSHGCPATPDQNFIEVELSEDDVSEVVLRTLVNMPKMHPSRKSVSSAREDVEKTPIPLRSVAGSAITDAAVHGPREAGTAFGPAREFLLEHNTDESGSDIEEASCAFEEDVGRRRGRRPRGHGRGGRPFPPSSPLGEWATPTHGDSGDEDRASDGGQQQPRAGEWTEDNAGVRLLDFTAVPGMQTPVPATPLGFIQLFITRELLMFFTNETNSYANCALANKSAEERAGWEGVNLMDIANYLGLTMAMGVASLPEIPMYWSTGKPYSMPAFRETMSCKRFKSIGRFFNCHNSCAVPRDNTDRLLQVRTVMEYFQSKFKALYAPNRELSLDEATLEWKGRLPFKVYNPQKPEKYGIKFYILAEAQTGYVFNFDIYVGIEKSIRNIVFGLMGPLLDKGYQLYMDNYYNSVKLTEELYEHGVHTCGTLRLSRGAPKDLQALAKMKIPRDSIHFRRKGNTFVICWMNTRLVTLITNIHNADTHNFVRQQKTRKRDGTALLSRIELQRPNAIADYMDHMRGVVHFDQMIQYYHFTRKTHKWTKKIVLYFLQMALHNAYVLYKKYSTDEKKLTLLAFHEVLFNALIHFDPQEWAVSVDVTPHAPNLPLALVGAPVTPRITIARTNAAAATSTTTAAATGDEQEAGPSGVSTTRRQRFAPGSDVDDEAPDDPSPSAPAKHKRPRLVDPSCRLTQVTEHAMTSIMPSQRRCRVCYRNGRRRDTTWECNVCKIPLCLRGDCFVQYHSQKQYWTPPPPSTRKKDTASKRTATGSKRE